jgi:hypothetical protein
MLYSVFTFKLTIKVPKNRNKVNFIGLQKYPCQFGILNLRLLTL